MSPTKPPPKKVTNEEIADAAHEARAARQKTSLVCAEINTMAETVVARLRRRAPRQLRVVKAQR